MIALGVEIPDACAALLEPGTAVRVLYYTSRETDEIRHIRAVVDGSMIVFRVWRPSKRRWQYHVDTAYAFYLAWKDGCLTRA